MSDQSAERNLFEIETEITKEIFIAGQKELIKSQGLTGSWLFNIFGLLALAGVLGVAFSMIRIEDLSDRFYYGSLSAFLILPFLFALWFRHFALPKAHENNYQKHPHLSAPINFRVNQNGIQIKNNLADRLHPWEEITDKIETENFLILVISSIVTLPFPKEHFTSQQLLDLDSFYQAYRDPLKHEQNRKESFFALRKPLLLTLGITLLFILLQLWAGR